MRIWKLSHGKDIRDDWYNDALNKNFVMVHEDTLSKGQNTISQGDNVAVEGKLQVNSFKLPNGKDKKISSHPRV